MPDRLGPVPDDRAGGRGAQAPPVQNLPETCPPPSPRLRELPARAARPALPRLSAVLRVFSRRQRTWRRRLAPDRLDRAGRETADATPPRIRLTRASNLKETDDAGE